MDVKSLFISMKVKLLHGDFINVSTLVGIPIVIHRIAEVTMVVVFMDYHLNLVNPVNVFVSNIV